MYRTDSLYWLKHIDFIVLDILCLVFSFFVSCILKDVHPFGNNLYRFFFVSLIFSDLLVAVLFNTFKNVLKRGYYVEFTVTAKHTFVLVSLVLFTLFVVKKTAVISRLIIGHTFGFYIIITLIVRYAWKKHLFNNKETNTKVSKTLFIITNNNMTDKVIDKFTKTNFSGYKITGVCILDDQVSIKNIRGISAIDKEHCAKYIGKEWIDEVLIVLERYDYLDSDLFQDIVDTGVTVHLNILPIHNLYKRKKVVEKVGGYQVITLSLNYASTLQLLIKRIFDIVVGLIGCFITGIIFIFVAPIIYINSPGPIFFGQERVGKNGKHFKMYKFRSMYLDAEERKKELMDQNKISDAKMFKMDFDPRIIGNKILEDGTHKTGIGDFIRRTSLDEFPQFFNVLKGDMSVIGTRPPTIDEVELYDLHHYSRLSIKPGITGMWQVSGRSDITDFEEVVRLDKEYISNWNPGLDVKIFLKTIEVVLKKQGSV